MKITKKQLKKIIYESKENKITKIVKEGKDPAIISIVDKISQLEEEILSIDAIMEFDEPYPAEEISDLLKDKSIIGMRRGQLLRNKNLLSKAKKALDKKNLLIYKKIDSLVNSILRKFPKLKKIQYDLDEHNITDITGFYKNGSTWTLIAPDTYYDDFRLDDETVTQLKSFLMAMGRKIRNKRTSSFNVQYD